MNYRFATIADASILATLNQQLIRDEGHRNSTNVEQITERMSGWLSGDYKAVVVESHQQILGYALFRHEPDFVYLRQLFVSAEVRRQGIGRGLIRWLCNHAGADASRLRIDVLVQNTTGRQFWRSCGFEDYCVTMELPLPVTPAERPS